MKNNFSLKFKTFDVLVLVISILLIIASLVTTNVVFVSNKNTNNKIVQIYYQGSLLEDKQVDFDSIDNQLEIVLSKDKYDKLLGDMTILVDKEKGICVKDVECPNKICKNQGWVKSVGYPVVCLPNGVYIIINSKKVDQDTILG